MYNYTEIYVVRHGETVWNRQGRHQGRLNSPMTEKGRAQAAQIGLILARELGMSAAMSSYRARRAASAKPLQ
ncbi:histidine phosphatase family protein [Aliiroseovarius salicola]|uniref:histidine phosphatase family protein n=1 Tax=Aliiroseovarius salicola TaxID=3009082 RepID=UPI0038CC1B08